MLMNLKNRTLLTEIERNIEYQKLEWDNINKLNK